MTHLVSQHQKEKAKELQAFITDIQMIQDTGVYRRKRISGFVSWLENKEFGRASLHGPSIHLQRSNGEDLHMEDKKTKTDSPPTKDLIMVCSSVCQKARRKFLLQKGCKKLRGTSKDVRKTTFAPRERKKRKKQGHLTPHEEKAKKIKAPHQLKHPYLCGSSCEIIYEHCFEKLNSTIKATKVDLKTPLVRFLGEHSWSIGEVWLEITIGDAPLSRTETLNCVILRSDSPHNMLLGRTAMQRMGIVVLTIHRAIKFHTKKGVRTIADETDEGTKKGQKDTCHKQGKGPQLRQR
ncbi:hypothetical protein Tco_0793242 [Tanacetum coccineum]